MTAKVIPLIDVPEDDAQELSEEELVWRKRCQIFASALKPVPAEWYTTQPAPRSWLLRDTRHTDRPGLMAMGEVGSLIAAGGVGKTMVLFQLAIAVATGEPWLETFIPDASIVGKRVLFLLGEEDEAEAHRRLWAASRHAATPAAGQIVVMPLKGLSSALMGNDQDRNPAATGFHGWLADYLAREKFALCILDPMARFAGAMAEKDTAVATFFVTLLEALCKSGCAVLLAHHTPKQSRGNGPMVADPTARGVTALFDGVRSEFTLGAQSLKAKLESPEEKERLGTIVTLTCSKANYGRQADPVLLRRAQGGPLVPLGPDDLELVKKLQSQSGKKKAKRAEDEADKAEREAAKLIGQEKANATRQKASEELAAKAQSALRKLLTKQPGLSGREIESGMRALMGECSSPTARTAISSALLDGWVVTRPGPRRSLGHYLPESVSPTLLPES
jgi:RecA-family ATPase